MISMETAANPRSASAVVFQAVVEPCGAMKVKPVTAWRWGAWKRGRDERTPVRAYLCPHCGSWHVTSQRPRTEGPSAPAEPPLPPHVAVPRESIAEALKRMQEGRLRTQNGPPFTLGEE